MSDWYLAKIATFVFSRTVIRTDALQVIAAAAIPAAYRLARLPMPDSTSTEIAAYIGLFISAYLLIKLICAPYFIWREDQKNIKEIRDAASSPEAEMRKYAMKAVANDRIALAGAIAALRASVTQIRQRQATIPSDEWVSSRGEVIRLAERLSFDEKLSQDCREVVHLGDLIVDSVKNHEDCRGEVSSLEQLSKDVQRRAISIV
jgi:hypothetical protein